MKAVSVALPENQFSEMEGLQKADVKQWMQPYKSLGGDQRYRTNEGIIERRVKFLLGSGDFEQEMGQFMYQFMTALESKKLFPRGAMVEERIMVFSSPTDKARVTVILQFEIVSSEAYNHDNRRGDEEPKSTTTADTWIRNPRRKCLEERRWQECPISGDGRNPTQGNRRDSIATGVAGGVVGRDPVVGGGGMNPSAGSTTSGGRKRTEETRGVHRKGRGQLSPVDETSD